MVLPGCLRTLGIAVLFSAVMLAATTEETRQAAETVTRNLDVQQKLPNDSDSMEPSAEDRSPDWFSGSEEGPDAGIPSEIWGVVQWVMIAIVAVTTAVWLGIWFSESWQRRQPSGIPRTSAPSGGDDAAPLDPAQALALADEWAAAGRYGPAMHQVWLAAVAVLAPRLAHAAPDSLTSWELMNVANLQPGERQALRNVVMRVDRAWFGKQPAGLADYQAVRGSYTIFASAAGGVTA